MGVTILALIKALQTQFLIGVVIFFSSIAHATNAIRIKKEKSEVYDFVDILILVLLAGFSGFLFSLGPLGLGLNIYWTLAFAGVGGFLGIEGLNAVSRTVLDLLVKYITNKNKNEGQNK